ncbi:DUF2975 domain-containing protein [Tsuneonella sp. HG222]
MIKLPTMSGDPLLIAAQVFILFVMALLAIGIAALAIGAGYVAIDPGALTAEFVEEGMTSPGGQETAAIIGIMGLAIVALALMFLFLATLSRIIESVAAGDPFAPINATRLSRMAWLMVAVQAITVPIGAIGLWLGQRIKDVDLDIGISGEGVAMALILFILARVFRHGAAMRADLEGTV